MNNSGFSNSRELKYAEKDCERGESYTSPVERPKFYITDVATTKDIERCVMPGCGAETGYLITTPIQQRMGYVEGAGQLCAPCYESTFGGRKR
ncbi:hypothetical protein HYT23_04415 [Candidatus Pacearchaeota archaeon]|nr:hypothetical protein [Candidatus Pacearchaeota archaeon]